MTRSGETPPLAESKLDDDATTEPVMEPTAGCIRPARPQLDLRVVGVVSRKLSGQDPGWNTTFNAPSRFFWNMS